MKSIKVISHEFITKPNGVVIDEYTLNTGYKFQDLRDENGDQASALWTSKGKPVSAISKTYQLAEKAVDTFTGFKG